MNEIYRTMALKINNLLVNTTHEPPLTSAEQHLRYRTIESMVRAVVEAGAEYHGNRSFDPKLFYHMCMSRNQAQPTKDITC